MKIYYSASSYASHLRAAKAYRALMGRAYPLVDNVASADLVILHHEPRDFAALYADYPELRRKYVVSYCVWEADELPEAYKRSLSHVQEVWTCSGYSKAAFDKHHPNVRLVPHVVERDCRFSPADLQQVQQRLRYDSKQTYFLAIALQASVRKNLSALVRAFNAVQSQLPDAKLVLKTGVGEDSAWATDSVITLPHTMRWSEVNALYHVASVYVSAHHAEGWGLTLSDAMLFGKPVIATGYSGNREYMNQNNSFLVEYTEDYVRPEDCEDLFHSGMRWAYPNEEDLQRKLRFVHEHRYDEAVSGRVRTAAEELRRFDAASVGALLHARLGEIAGALGRDHAP